MSGHSKWSTIKHKKAKTDAQKGKQFTKAVREIMMAVKLGGADPDGNMRLRLAIDKAKEVNMPHDNIKRAIAKGSGPSDGTVIEEVLFEAYAPGGVALLIETLTDNKNRTVPNLRTILGKAGGTLASKGAVSYQFDKKGLVYFEPGFKEEVVMEAALSANVEDVKTNADGSIEVISDPVDLEDVKAAFKAANLKFESSSLIMVPQLTVNLDKEQADVILKLVDKLEDDDDVQNVFGNFEISDDIMDALAS